MIGSYQDRAFESFEDIKGDDNGFRSQLSGVTSRIN